MKKIFIIALVMISIILVGFFANFFGSRKAKLSFKEYSVATGDLELSVQATGSVQPENRLVVKPQIAGRIDEILVEEGKSVKAGQVMAWMSSNDRAALVDMARAGGTTEQKRWEDIYKPSPIIAPLGGVVISKQVEKGQTIGTGDTVFVISDRLIILAQVDETDLAKIGLGQDVEIRIDAYSSQSITGKVLRIAYESKQVNNVTIYEIRILPTTAPEFMRSGMTTSVKFIQDEKKNILLLPVSYLIPAQAVEKAAETRPMTPGSSHRVLLKTTSEDAPPIERDVTIGLSNGKMAEVISGITAGDIILQREGATEEQKRSANPFNPFSAPKTRKK